MAGQGDPSQLQSMLDQLDIQSQTGEDASLQPLMGFNTSLSLNDSVGEFKPVIYGGVADYPMKAEASLSPYGTPSSADKVQRVRATVDATTSPAKTEDSVISYMRLDYSYSLMLQAAESGMHRTIISLKFAEATRRARCQNQVDAWHEEHPGAHMLELVSSQSSNLLQLERVQDDESLSSVSFTWDGSKPAVAGFKVNCLSSKFTEGGRGGEKGVLLQLAVETQSATTGQTIDVSAMDFKTYRSKGVISKRLAMDATRLKKDPAGTHHIPSKESTTLRPLEIVVAANSYDRPPPLRMPGDDWQLPDTTGPSVGFGGQAGSFNILDMPGLSPLDLPDIVPSSSPQEVAMFLLHNGFQHSAHHFGNYTGDILLQLSKEDFARVMIPGEALRLYFMLHGNSAIGTEAARGTSKGEKRKMVSACTQTQDMPS